MSHETSTSPDTSENRDEEQWRKDLEEFIGPTVTILRSNGQWIRSYNDGTANPNRTIRN